MSVFVCGSRLASNQNRRKMSGGYWREGCGGADDLSMHSRSHGLLTVSYWLINYAK
jgi:hypothetical protein